MVQNAPLPQCAARPSIPLCLHLVPVSASQTPTYRALSRPKGSLAGVQANLKDGNGVVQGPSAGGTLGPALHHFHVITVQRPLNPPKSQELQELQGSRVQGDYIDNVWTPPPPPFAARDHPPLQKGTVPK